MFLVRFRTELGPFPAHPAGGSARLLAASTAIHQRLDPTRGRQAESIHDAWWPRLGLDCEPGVSKGHWKRIRALSRRLNTPGLGDEYDNLKPVADLLKQLQDRLTVLLQNPIRWVPAKPIDDARKQQVFDGRANAL